jgi:hypothetical protein
VTTFVPPPNTPTHLEHAVCPEHGLERSGPIGCHCEANYDDDIICVCPNVGKTWCGDCHGVVEHPLRVVYMIAGTAPLSRNQPEPKGEATS